MIHKLSIRWRITLLSTLLLTVCVFGLTLTLNLSAYGYMDSIEAAEVIMPAIDITQQSTPMLPLNTQAAKKGFQVSSLLIMAVFISSGSWLTYLVCGKVLRPLEQLNEQVRNINSTNLSERIKIPASQDEISQLGESFNHLIERLNQAFLIQKRFAASAAHELRTPLAILQTKLDVFKKRPQNNEADYQKLITSFDSQTHRLRTLVTSLLELSSEQSVLTIKTFSLDTLILDIFDQLHSQAADSKVSLQYEASNHELIGDRVLLHQAFFNLIENAIKYNRPGGYVLVHVQKFDDSLEISFIDNGIGIAQTERALVMEPFYRVEASRSRSKGGAGLGLAIVSSIVANHSGHLEIRDSERTCIVVTL